jgi:hypothetical protein
MTIMNVISRHKKFISVILIFLILIQIPGCVNTKPFTSVSDIPVYKKYTYIVHSPTTKYQILNFRFSDDTISGNLINGKHAKTTHKVHFYVPADSVLKFNSDMTLVLPVDKISKIELETPAKGATAILIAGSLIVAVIIITVLSIDATGYYGGI